MRVKLTSNLWYGDQAECEAPDMEAVLHCCKNPCHAKRHGQKPEKNSPHYLAEDYAENGRQHMLLNMIDPPAPLFNVEIFLKAVSWARKQIEAGKRLMIHCNQGESRAPSVALVISAMLLNLVPKTSYGEAIAEFEHQTGITYAPGKGIRIFLEQNWTEIRRAVDQASIMWKDAPSEPVHIPPPPEFKMPDAKEAQAFVKRMVLAHFTTFTQIEDKRNKWIQPEPNVLQFDIAEAYQWCIENNIPCRLIILKPRQVGCSTFTAQVCYHHMRRFPHNMMVMGDVTKRTEAVYRVFNRISDNDSFPWDSQYHYDTRKGTFLHANGQTTKVMYGTANDPKAGISEARQVVWMTEAARYAKTGVRMDTNVITALLNSIASEPNTVAIAESTAEGAVGWFYSTYQGSVSLEERKAGRIGNGWIHVFAPWFAFPEHSIPRSVENADWFERDLNDRERRGIKLYGWNSEQVAWRRRQIKQACNNDERMFDQDFPEDAESCFLASGRPRFCQEGLTRLTKLARDHHKMARYGVIERNDRGKVMFRDAPEGEAWCRMFEDPTYGLSYIGAVDPCTGEQSEGSAYPDAHGAGILRVGYMEDDKQTYHNDMVAAVIDVENGCRWDDTLFAERYKLLLELYGDCMVVVETGNGLGVINALQNKGARLYRRRKQDNLNPNKMLDVVGWHTDNNTRALWVGAISDGIRNQNVDCFYEIAVSEARTFYINDRGKAKAKSGCHDDWITFLGLALYCKDFADKLLPPPSQFGGKGPINRAPTDLGSLGSGAVS